MITGFGGWPVPFAPVGLGAGAMVNAVFSCKGRVGDPHAREKARKRKRKELEEQGQIAPRARGSQLAQRLGWAPTRKRRRKRPMAASVPRVQSQSPSHVTAVGNDNVALSTTSDEWVREMPVEL